MSYDNLMPDFDSLRPGHASERGASRRVALKVALGVGYAACTVPVVAETAIRTATEGLKTGIISFEVAGFSVPAYFAAPEGRSNLPVVLVVQEIFGVHEYIADVCRRLAKAGYLAIAPALYARQGDAGSYTDTAKLMAEIVSRVPDAQVMADLDGAVKWAGAHGGDLDKVGITGFCWGGRITWLYAAQGPVKAAVAWYGRLVGASSELTPKHPIDLAPVMRAPVLGLYGEKDGGIPLDTVDKMKAALAQGTVASKAAQFVVYPEAPHAFHADYRPSFRADPAQDGWMRCLAWFRAHGVV